MARFQSFDLPDHRSFIPARLESLRTRLREHGGGSPAATPIRRLSRRIHRTGGRKAGLGNRVHRIRRNPATASRPGDALSRWAVLGPGKPPDGPLPDSRSSTSFGQRLGRGSGRTCPPEPTSRLIPGFTRSPSCDNWSRLASRSGASNPIPSTNSGATVLRSHVRRSVEWIQIW